MSTSNDGGPAFPRPGVEYVNSPEVGMSLRDWFAGQALASIPPGYWNDCQYGAQYCYDYADAMLAARQQGGAK